MKRNIISGILILVCFILQCTVFRAFDYGGIVPNLLIILTASFGFMRGETTGLIIGFVCGLLTDIFFADIIGFYALVYMYIGFVNGKFCRLFYPEDIKLPIALIVGSDFLYNILIYLLTFLLNGRFQFLYYFFNIMIPEMVYTIIVTCIFYPLLLFSESLLERNGKEGVSKIV